MLRTPSKLRTLRGLTLHVARGGGRTIEPLTAPGPAALILLAFLINAAVPPLHAWLTDAYPESSPAGTVFLPAFATKAAVCALARVFPGLAAEAGHRPLVAGLLHLASVGTFLHTGLKLPWFTFAGWKFSVSMRHFFSRVLG